MTRKKVKLAYIANDSSRKATFKKRKKGLLKKVNELSTLCGITACAIIYSPYDSNPEVWPSNSGVQRVVSDFQTLPEMDQHKKMVDQESFLKQRIAKASEHLKKQKKDNREIEMTEIMFQCLVGNTGMFHLNIMDLNDLGYMIEQYLKDINRRIEILGNAGMEMGNVVATVTTTTAPTAVIHEVGSSSSFAAAAAFFNPFQHHHQQQCRHPPVRHVGFYEQTRNLNLNQNHNQNQQQFFMEIMNHPEQISYAAEHMSFPFMDDNNHNHHHQQQRIPNNSSTAPTIVSSNSIIPVTSPNVNNNVWFR
ncbi:hypothetical protein EUTSA_v10023873mg [Eutrema salsugineum]|uniref:MADS-box domain-containing protein n=1 Tax=Eutrema salsugineum TaxID=72664 RepID=V4KPY2_EUTSA|nr:agamous-like MADS-box protein AGL80 [Eutrema salsugineum]ESQ29443.1 hypothetical protein EUTSA_v10023873mg [Eutrema salsugineum]